MGVCSTAHTLISITKFTNHNMMHRTSCPVEEGLQLDLSLKVQTVEVL